MYVTDGFIDAYWRHFGDEMRQQDPKFNRDRLAQYVRDQERQDPTVVRKMADYLYETRYKGVLRSDGVPVERAEFDQRTGIDVLDRYQSKGKFRTGVERGIQNLREGFSSALEGVGEIIDSDALREAGQKGIKAAQEEHARLGPAEDVTEIDSFESFKNWVAGTGGSGAIDLGSTAGGAIIGAAVRGSPGAYVGAFGVNYVRLYGEHREAQKAEQERQGKPVKVDEGLASSTAAAAAVLDLVAERFLIPDKAMKVIRGWFGAKGINPTNEQVAAVAKEVTGSIAKARAAAGRAARGVAVGGTQEGIAELGQAVIQRAQAGSPLTDAEAMNEYVNSLAAGGLVGGVARGTLELAVREEAAAEGPGPAAGAQPGPEPGPGPQGPIGEDEVIEDMPGPGDIPEDEAITPEYMGQRPSWGPTTDVPPEGPEGLPPGEPPGLPPGTPPGTPPEGPPGLPGGEGRLLPGGEPQPEPEPEQGAVQPTANRFFSEEQYEKDQARLDELLNRLNVGIDPELLGIGMRMAGYHIERGARTFSAYAQLMVDRFGDKIRPYLGMFYEAVRRDPGLSHLVQGMDPADVADEQAKAWREAPKQVEGAKPAGETEPEAKPIIAGPGTAQTKPDDQKTVHDWKLTQDLETGERQQLAHADVKVGDTVLLDPVGDAPPAAATVETATPDQVRYIDQTGNVAAAVNPGQPADTDPTAYTIKEGDIPVDKEAEKAQQEADKAAVEQVEYEGHVDAAMARLEKDIANEDDGKALTKYRGDIKFDRLPGERQREVDAVLARHRERMEQVEAEAKAKKLQAEQEAKEKAAKEKAEQEAKEKAAKEKAEKEAREAKEKEAREAREKADRDAQEKAEKEAKAKLSRVTMPMPELGATSQVMVDGTVVGTMTRNEKYGDYKFTPRTKRFATLYGRNVYSLLVSVEEDADSHLRAAQDMEFPEGQEDTDKQKASGPPPKGKVTLARPWPWRGKHRGSPVLMGGEEIGRIRRQWDNTGAYPAGKVFEFIPAGVKQPTIEVGTSKTPKANLAALVKRVAMDYSATGHSIALQDAPVGPGGRLHKPLGNDMNGSEWKDESDRLIAYLGGHGANTAKGFERILKWLVEMGRESGFEHMAVVDMDTGQVSAGSNLREGSVNRTRPAWDAMKNPNRNMAFFHNHPSFSGWSYPMSRGDIASLSEKAGEKSIVAIGHRGEVSAARRGDILKDQSVTYDWANGRLKLIDRVVKEEYKKMEEDSPRVGGRPAGGSHGGRWTFHYQVMNRMYAHFGFIEHGSTPYARQHADMDYEEILYERARKRLEENPPRGIKYRPASTLRLGGDIEEVFAFLTGRTPTPDPGREGGGPGVSQEPTVEKGEEGVGQQLGGVEAGWALGQTRQVFAPDGSSIEVIPEIVDASTLVASHDAKGSVNPEYPSDLQPRDRTRSASQLQISQIAAKLNPALLMPQASVTEGAPIVGDDNVVESGNGRVAAIRLAYSRGSTAYADALAQIADVSGMKEPVLIQRRVTPMTTEERAAFAREANARTTLEKSASEAAVADAKSITPHILDAYIGGDIDRVGNVDFVRRFIAGVVPAAEQGGMTTAGGTVSRAGITRIENAMFARAYGDAEMLSQLREEANTNFLAIGKAMIGAGPLWSKMKEDLGDQQHFDLTPNLLAAVNLLRQARRDGRAMAEVLAQQDAFTQIAPETEAFARMFFKDETLRSARSQVAVEKALREYAGVSVPAAVESARGDMFGKPTEVPAIDVLRSAFKRALGDDTSAAGQAGFAFSQEFTYDQEKKVGLRMDVHLDDVKDNEDRQIRIFQMDEIVATIQVRWDTSVALSMKGIKTKWAFPPSDGGARHNVQRALNQIAQDMGAYVVSRNPIPLANARDGTNAPYWDETEELVRFMGFQDPRTEKGHRRVSQWILFKGRSTGVEHIALADMDTGEIVTAGTSQRTYSVGVNADVRLNTGERNLMGWHNHPHPAPTTTTTASSAISTGDIQWAYANQDLKTFVALGQDGSMSAITPSDKLRKAWEADQDDWFFNQKRMHLRTLVDGVTDVVKTKLQGKVNQRELSRNGAYAIQGNVVNRLLADLSLFEYGATSYARTKHEQTIEEEVYESAREELYSQVIGPELAGLEPRRASSVQFDENFDDVLEFAQGVERGTPAGPRSEGEGAGLPQGPGVEADTGRDLDIPQAQVDESPLSHPSERMLEPVQTGASLEPFYDWTDSLLSALGEHNVATREGHARMIEWLIERSKERGSEYMVVADMDTGEVVAGTSGENSFVGIPYNLVDHLDSGDRRFGHWHTHPPDRHPDLIEWADRAFPLSREDLIVVTGFPAFESIVSVTHDRAFSAAKPSGATRRRFGFVGATTGEEEAPFRKLLREMEYMVDGAMAPAIRGGEIEEHPAEILSASLLNRVLVRMGIIDSYAESNFALSESEQELGGRLYAEILENLGQEPIRPGSDYREDATAVQLDEDADKVFGFVTGTSPAPARSESGEGAGPGDTPGPGTEGVAGRGVQGRGSVAESRRKKPPPNPLDGPSTMALADQTTLATYAGPADKRPFQDESQELIDSLGGVNAATREGQQKVADWVLAKGRETGVEHLVIVDMTNGALHAGTVNASDSVALTFGASMWMQNTQGRLVAWHNHPSDHALSPGDLEFVFNHSIDSIVALGHDGSVTVAGATKATKDWVRAHSVTEVLEHMAVARVLIDAGFYTRMIDEEKKGTLTKKRSDYLLDDMRNRLLMNLGVIEYGTNIIQSDLEQEVYEDAARDQDYSSTEANFFFGADSSIPYRHADPIRIGGDLAELFDFNERAGPEQTGSEGGPAVGGGVFEGDAPTETETGQLEPLLEDAGRSPPAGEPVSWTLEERQPDKNLEDFLKRAAEAAGIENAEEVAGRMAEAAKGVEKKTLIAWGKEQFAGLGKRMVRRWEALQENQENAEFVERARQLHAADNAARTVVNDYLVEFTTDLNDEEMNLLTTSFVLNDFLWTASQEMEVAFGLSKDRPAEIRALLDEVMKQINADPKLKAKHKLHYDMLEDIRRQLIEHKVLTPERMRNKHYFMHQVLEYAKVDSDIQSGIKKKVKSPFYHRRKGSELDINMNYHQVWSKFLFRANMDIAAAKFLNWLRRSKYNSLPDYRSRAKLNNNTALGQRFHEILMRLVDPRWRAGLDARLSPFKHNPTRYLREMREIDRENMNTIPWEHPDMEPITEYARHVGNIARGMEALRARLLALDEDVRDRIPRRFDRAIQSLMLHESDPVGSAAGELGTTDFFRFLDWIINENEDPGLDILTYSATAILGATGKRKQWVRSYLGDTFIDPTDSDALLRKFGDRHEQGLWQADAWDGRQTTLTMFFAQSVPERAFNRLADRISELAGNGETAVEIAEVIEFLGKIDTMLAVGKPKEQMILGQNLISALNQFGDPQEDARFLALIQRTTQYWRIWTLFNMVRYTRYIVNNLAGDFDAIGGSGYGRAIFGSLPRAWRDIRAFHRTGQAPRLMREAMDRGVMWSAQTSIEFEDVVRNDFSVNQKLRYFPARWVKWYLDKVRGLAVARENLFRYAAFLGMHKELIERGKTPADAGYGSTPPDVIAGLEGMDLVTRMAVDIMGDYWLPQSGRWLRQHMIPFWSWQHSNAKRYVRRMMNIGIYGWHVGLNKSLPLGVWAGASAAVRLFWVFGAYMLWNWLVFGDEEEELSQREQMEPHIILWRTDEGRIIKWRSDFALPDFLGWLDYDGALATAKEVVAGRAAPSDVFVKMAKGPPNRVLNSLVPWYKTGLELHLGRQWWPDATAGRPINDRMAHAARMLSLEGAYIAIANAFGEPVTGRSMGDRMLSTVTIDMRDPGEQAYLSLRAKAFGWLENIKDRPPHSAERSRMGQLLYYWKAAMRYENEEAAEKIEELVREEILESTGKPGNPRLSLNRSLRTARPLGMMNRRLRAEFLRTMSASDRAEYDRARAWYRKAYGRAP